MHNTCLSLWQVYELHSRVYMKCPLYGTSYTAVHGQDSLILLCRTKVSEILLWFIHQTLTPPHLCNPAYYQRSSVTRKITLWKRHDKVQTALQGTSYNVLVCPLKSLCRAQFGKEASVPYKKPRKYVQEYNSSRLSRRQPAHISGNQHRITTSTPTDERLQSLRLLLTISVSPAGIGLILNTHSSQAAADSAGWAGEVCSSPAPRGGRGGSVPSSASARPSARARQGNEPQKERKGKEKKRRRGGRGEKRQNPRFCISLKQRMWESRCSSAQTTPPCEASVFTLPARLPSCPPARPKPFLLLGSSLGPQPRRDGGLSPRAPGSTWPLTAPPAPCPPQTSVFRSKTHSANPSLPPSQYGKAKLLHSDPRGFPFRALAKSHNKHATCKERGLW